jgi:hypothetical protein
LAIGDTGAGIDWETKGMSDLQHLKIRANEDLANRWESLGRRVQLVGYIIRIDKTIPTRSFMTWQQSVYETVDMLKDLILDTERYVTRDVLAQDIEDEHK